MYANNGSMCTIIGTITNLTPFYNPHNSEMSLKAQDKEDKNVTLIQNNIKMILIWDTVHESNDSGNGCGRVQIHRNSQRNTILKEAINRNVYFKGNYG